MSVAYVCDGCGAVGPTARFGLLSAAGFAQGLGWLVQSDHLARCPRCRWKGEKA